MGLVSLLYAGGMTDKLTYRKATKNDLQRLIELLFEDELGQTREHLSDKIDACYEQAFQSIDIDPNQFLMVVLLGEEIVGTCHLTMMPSLTFCGSTRLQIEAVRISSACRGNKIGEWMLQQAIDYGRSKGAKIIQLTTNKKRTRAKKFYEKFGFESSHEGMKLYLML